MKSRLAARLVLLPLAAAALLLPLRRVQAQAGLDAPPAYGVAQRLTTQAQAAEQSAQALTAANDPTGAFQQDIAHRRALQATAKYREVVSSHAYGAGPWGAEALFQESQVQSKYLHDDNGAIQSLQTLQNNYKGIQFPSQPQAAATLASLETAVDQHNKTTPPGSILYRAMDFFVNLFGGSKFSYSYFLAIFAISLLVRLALTPLSNKQFASMREMQKLQPQIKELQGKYKNDKEAQGRKVMELYKEHGVNPAAGCLPMLVQLPILYLLYYMIRLYQYQFNYGHFLWVGSPLANLIPGGIVAPNLGQQDIPLLLLYALSMYVTQKLTVTPSLDPQQAEQQKTMAVMTPFLSTYFFLQWHLPSAFVLYYLIFNVLSTVQQKYYMRRRHADIHGEPDVDKDDDGDAPRNKPLRVSGPTSGGNARQLPSPGSKGGPGAGLTRRPLPGRDTPLSGAKNGASANGLNRNGSTPTAEGVIAPAKVHPKKKRR